MLTLMIEALRSPMRSLKPLLDHIRVLLLPVSVYPVTFQVSSMLATVIH